MNIYEIDEAMNALVDPETGEIKDFEAFDALSMERERKIENVACWCKNESKLAEGIKAEIAALRARQAAAENRVKRLKDYLLYATQGVKTVTPRAQVSFRSSISTEITDGAALMDWAQSSGHDELLTYALPEISKSKVKEAIESGLEVPGARIVSNTSVIVK